MSLPRCGAPDDLDYWIALHRAPAVGSRRFAALLDRFGTPRAVFEAGPADWRAAGLPEGTLRYLQDPDWRAVDADLAWLGGGGRHCLTRRHPAYPPLLSEIPDPPPLLFVEGESTALSRRHIAIVGSRNPSPAGRRIAQGWAEALVAAGLGVVSGLALGIDAAGHRGALDGGGITVAVSGTGPDRVYPHPHRVLAEEIVAGGGALATEFPVGTAPRAVNFPRRNRIISGLSLGTLVVEAALRSGSLITARLAAEQNREVFAVPGSIDSPLARGCNQLIQEGAKLVQTVSDILDELEPRMAMAVQREATDFRATASLPDSEILKCIAYAPTSVDTLVAATGRSAEAVCSELLLLELQGYISSAPGGGYMRIK